jgi:GT2 family glycosyltransferase
MKSLSSDLVSLIIVTYNNEKDIQQCLESLSQQTYQHYEIIIVDNASRDSTLKIIEEFTKINNKITTIRLDSNVGFAKGNNIGLQYAAGRYIALLNPDTEASASWLEALMAVVNNTDNDNYGIYASKLLISSSGLIDSAGDGCTTTGKGYKRGEGLLSSEFQEQEEVFGACGGAMLINKQVIADIGFLDEDFFLIFEDTDFCFRARLAGWRCLFVPKAIVYHKVRTSIGNMSDMAVYYSIRNSNYVWLKNIPTKLLIIYLHEKMLQNIISFFYFGIKHKKLKIYFQANFDVLKSLLSLLNKRRLITKSTIINTKAIYNMLTSIWQKDFLEQKSHKFFK